MYDAERKCGIRLWDLMCIASQSFISKSAGWIQVHLRATKFALMA